MEKREGRWIGLGEAELSGLGHQVVLMKSATCGRMATIGVAENTMREQKQYGEPTGDPTLGFESARDLDAISDHIERYWGKVEEVFHEIVSEYVHIDIHVVQATADRPYHVLVTSGMSDRPMFPPEGMEECGYAELVLALPNSWPIDQASFDDECNYWPLRLLKVAARFPHVYRTWLWHRHSLAVMEELEAFAPDVSFCGSILSTPILCDKAACRLQISPEKQIQFLSLLPLYEEELLFTRSEGADALFEKLKGIGVTELIDKRRANVCR
jgi:hypothetical protein